MLCRCQVARCVGALLAAHEASGSFLNKPQVDVGKTVDSNLGAARPGLAGEPGQEGDDLRPPCRDGQLPLKRRARRRHRRGATCCSRKLAKGAWAKSGSPSKPSPSNAGRPEADQDRHGFQGRLTRFEQERQALAMMDHPNIARVLDGYPLVDRAIREDLQNIKHFLPAVTATNIRYGRGATRAVVWNEGGSGSEIYLPPRDGWYVPDNPFAIPNGRPSNINDLNALFLMRERYHEFSGRVARCFGVSDRDAGRRYVLVNDFSSDVPGVALVNHEPAATLEMPTARLEAIQEIEKLIRLGSDEDIQTLLRHLQSRNLL